MLTASRAKRPCYKPRCPGLAEPPRQFCDQHRDLEMTPEQQRNKWRGTAAARGYDHLWAAVRERALKRDKYLCQPCAGVGKVTPASEVHHTLKVSTHPEARLDIKRLVSCCSACHKILERFAT